METERRRRKGKGKEEGREWGRIERKKLSFGQKGMRSLSEMKVIV